jgi:hypothetical protein
VEGVKIENPLAADGADHVARLEPGGFRRRPLVDTENERAALDGRSFTNATCGVRLTA